MNTIPYTSVLALSAVLFAIGAVGVLLRRNGIAIFVAAAEAAVGLALFIALHRLKGSIDVDRANILRW
jgi:NADH:ubiquinone oxidoreductase subunit K